MRDLWLICERCCCEEPCLIFIGGGGQTCERQQKPCVTRGDRTLEWWRPLTKEDIKAAKQAKKAEKEAAK